MSYPLQIDARMGFLGENRGISPVMLPDGYSPAQSSNIRIDILGRITNRLGYSQLNSSEFLLNTSSQSPLRVRGITAFRTIGAAGAETHQLVFVLEDANEWELWYSADGGATATFIADLGSTSVGRPPDFAQVENLLYITNGVMDPRVWNGSALSTAGATQSPTPTATGTSSNGGPLNGRYKYKLVSVEGDGTKAAGSDASNEESVQTGTVALSWTADGNTDVVGYEIYRTTGTGELYYFVGWSEGRTVVAFTDTLSDIDLLGNQALQTHGEPPPSGAYFVEAHLGRMWYLRTDSFPNRAWYSDPGLPQSVGLNSYFDLDGAAPVVDKITGAMGDYEKKMIIFTDRGVWTIAGTGVVIGGIQDFSIHKTAARAGAAGHNTITRIPAGAIFTDSNGEPQKTAKSMLAYLTADQDVRLFDGENDIIISTPIHDAIRANWDDDHRHKSFAVHNVKEGLVTWFWAVTSGSGDEVSTTAVTWDYRHGAWFTWLHANAFACGTTAPSSPSPLGIVMGSGEAGRLYKYWDTNKDVSASIACRWASGPIFGRLGEDTVGREQAKPAIANEKRFRWVDIVVGHDDDEHNLPLSISWTPGELLTGRQELHAGTVTVPAPDFSGQTFAVRRLLKGGSGQQASDYPHGFTLGFIVTFATRTDLGGIIGLVDSVWHFHGFNVAYQLLPGMKRRMP